MLSGFYAELAAFSHGWNRIVEARRASAAHESPYCFWFGRHSELTNANVLVLQQIER